MKVKIDALKRATDQRPFQPFRICLAGGVEVAVDNPGCIAHREGCQTAAVIDQGHRLHIIDLAHLVRIRLEETEGLGI